MKKTRIVWLLVGGLLLAGASSSFAGWYNTSWIYRKTITIDHTKVPTDQASFPVLVSLSADSGVSSHALSTGNDILFTASDGTTKIPYERESYASGTLVAWVKVTALSHTADTVLYLYYGNAGASDQQDASNVWDANHKGVWHLKENPTGTAPQMKDSTTVNNGTAGSAFASGDQQAAQIAGGLHFGGANNYDVSIANESNFDFDRANTFSIEYWAKPTSGSTGKQCPISKLQNSGVFPGYEIGNNVNGPGGTNTAGKLRVTLVNSATGTKHQIVVSTTAATKLNDGSWHQYIYTYSGSGTASGVKIYEDGVALSTSLDEDDLGANSILNNTPVHLGSRENQGNYYNGLLDEVRISSSVRSADWITTEYNNQKSPSTFYALGSEQALTAIRVETAANGGGTVVAAQGVTAGNSITGYAVARDASANFLDNVAATWSLVSKTGGVVTGDLVAAGDTKSATFTGHLTGTAAIDAALGALTKTESGTITVNAAAASKLVFTTSAATVTAGAASTIITVQRQDSFNNPNTTDGTITVNLTKTSSTGSFLNTNGVTTITSTNILNGSSTASFFYKDTAVGTPTITNAATGLTSATQTETVTKATPVFSGLTASQGITYGTASVTLSGTVSATGPVYANNGGTVGVTINGSTQNATIAGGSGAFSINFTTPTIPASAYTITYAFSGDANLNAAANNTSTALTVNKKPITVSNIAANNKVYDQSTTATIRTNGWAFTGVINGDQVTLLTNGYTATFTPDAGAHASKAVTVTGLSLGGSGAGNYSLTQPSLTADITPKGVTVASGVTADNKVYNASTTATIETNGNVQFTGIISGDALLLVTNGYSANFANATVGTGKSVTVTGTSLGGSSGTNYSLTAQPAGLTADIQQAATTVAINSSSQTNGYLDATTFTATLPSDATGSVTFKTNGGALSVNSLTSGSATSDVTSSIPRGTNVITAEYPGDINYIGSTNSLYQVVTNHPPVAVADSYVRNSGMSLKITIASLLTNDTDIDQDAVSFVSAATTTNGVTVTQYGGLLLVPTNNVDDAFEYVITDNQGGTNTGWVYITVTSSHGQNASVAVDQNTSTATATFFGVPGVSYTVQRATNISFNLGLTNLCTIVAPSNGAFTVTDDFSDLGGAPDSAFYRLLVP